MLRNIDNITQVTTHIANLRTPVYNTMLKAFANGGEVAGAEGWYRLMLAQGVRVITDGTGTPDPNLSF